MILSTRTDSNWYSRTFTLGETDYVLTFGWNARFGAWFLDVADAAGVVLVASIRLLPSIPLLARFTDPTLPSGLLFVTDSSGSAVEPGLTDLGVGARCQLHFFTFAELAA